MAEVNDGILFLERFANDSVNGNILREQREPMFRVAVTFMTECPKDLHEFRGVDLNGSCI
jgi:hypothetical protein